MKLEKVLEKLEELFRKWGLSTEDWMLIANYAFKLQGYRVKLREGHFNVIVNEDKLWWKTSPNEVFPPKNSKEFRELKKWMKITGFSSDLIPQNSDWFKRIEEGNTIFYALPNGKNIRLITLCGELKEVLDLILAQCTKKGLGVEKGRFMYKTIENFKKAAKEKKDRKAIKEAERLLEKYAYFIVSESESFPLSETIKVRERIASDYFRKKKIFFKDYSGIRKFKGTVAYKGKIRGKVRVILDEGKAVKLKKDEILVVKMTSAKFTPFINRAKAIVTDNGGLLCHAAIVSREFNIPCIVATKIATKVLKDGQLVEVDANKGIVKILKQN